MARMEQVSLMELGKLADLAVLDRDLFETEPAEFTKVNIVETVLNGETVYRA